MGEILYNYGWIILLVLAICVYFYWYFKKYGRVKTLDRFRETAYQFMLLAEKRFGDGEGHIKFMWVVERFYPILPDTLKFFISKEAAEGWLQELYDELKDLLDDGQFNDSNLA